MTRDLRDDGLHVGRRRTARLIRESGLFKTLKSELIWRTAFETRADAAAATGRYIDGFYNPIRRHSALDFTSPAQFEKMAAT